MKGSHILDSVLFELTGRLAPPSPVREDLSRRLRDPLTRRHFLRAGLSVGVVAALQIWPNFPAHAATTWFVSSVTGDNSTGASWTTAKTSIAAGIALASAGDTILVDAAHSFTATAAITYTPPAGGLAIISVTPSGAASYSAFTSGATEAVGAASNNFSIAGVNSSALYLSGLVVTGSTNNAGAAIINLLVNANVSGYMESVNCKFTLPTIATNTIVIGAASATNTSLRFRSCTFEATGSRAGSLLTLQLCNAEYINTTISVTGGTKPSSLITSAGNALGRHVFKDSDLTGYAVSGGAYVLLTNINGTPASIEIRKCKISATPTLTTGTWPQGNGSILLINTDSGNTDYKFHYENAYGTLDADSTVYKTGGSSINGTPVSWKIVTSANASEFKPFVTLLLQIWDTTTTSQTPAVAIAQASGATGLTDRQMWPTQDFPTSASTTQFTFETGRNTQPFVGTGATWATDGVSSWTGLSTPVLQSLGAGAFTAARAGLIEGRLLVGIASTTVYANALMDGIT